MFLILLSELPAFPRMMLAKLCFSLCDQRAAAPSGVFSAVKCLIQVLLFWSKVFFSPQDCPSGSGSRSSTTTLSAPLWSPCTPSPSATRGVGSLPQSTALSSLHSPGTSHKTLNKRPPLLCPLMFLLKVRSRTWTQKFILLQPSAQFIPQHGISQVTAWQQ